MFIACIYYEASKHLSNIYYYEASSNIYFSSRKTDMKVLLYPCYTRVPRVIICLCIKEQLPLHSTNILLGMYYQKEL